MTAGWHVSGHDWPAEDPGITTAEMFEGLTGLDPQPVGDNDPRAPRRTADPERWIVAGGRQGGKRKAADDEINARLLAGWAEVTGDPALRMDGLRLFEAPSRPGVLERTGGDTHLARIYLDAARRLLPEVRAHDAALGPTAMHLDETAAERRAVLDLLDEADAANAELRRQADRVARVVAQRDAAWAREGELATALRRTRGELAELKGDAGTPEAPST